VSSNITNIAVIGTGVIGSGWIIRTLAHNKKVTAFAGIGNPENFFNLLKDNEIDLVKKIKFPDHHKYSEKELRNLINETKENNTILVTTEKDYFRISKNFKKNINYLKGGMIPQMIQKMVIIS